MDDEYEIWGQVLDADLFPLFGRFRVSSNGGTGDPAFDASYPAVTYNPDLNQYLVVWDGDSNTGGLVDDELEIRAQRVGYSGVLIGSDIRTSDMGGTGNASFAAVNPDVTYNGHDHEYLVVWAGDDNVGGLVDNEYEIFGQLLISSTGGSTGPNDERISDAGDLGNTECAAGYPVVAANTWNGELLVAWQGDEDEYYFVPGETEIIIQRMDGMALFVDGFESGDTTGWSSAVP